MKIENSTTKITEGGVEQCRKIQIYKRVGFLKFIYLQRKLTDFIKELLVLAGP